MKKKATKIIIQYTLNFLNNLNDKKEDLPNSLRIIFAHLTNELRKKFPEEEYIGYIGVSSFLFLRLVCASINSPKLFKLMDDHPEPRVAKILTQVAKTIIKISTLNPNNTNFDPSQDLNIFIESEAQRMRDLMDFFCNPKDESEWNPASVELDKQISILVEYLEENLGVSIAEYFVKEEDITLCQNLIGVLDNLAKKEKSRYPYLEQLLDIRMQYGENNDVDLSQIPQPRKMNPKKSKKNRTRTTVSSSAKVEKRRS